MVKSDLTPKPAYDEIRLLTSSLKGETYNSTLSDGNSSDWLLVFTSASGQQTLAAWTTGTSHAVTVSGWGRLHLTSTPFYVNPTLLPGDANLDGTVNVPDLAILAANYRKRSPAVGFKATSTTTVWWMSRTWPSWRPTTGKVYASNVVPDYAGFYAEAIKRRRRPE